MYGNRIMATIICKTFPDDLAKRLRMICMLRGISIQDTIKQTLSDFITIQETSDWYHDALMGYGAKIRGKKSKRL
jgi:hypothetical protein